MALMVLLEDSDIKEEEDAFSSVAVDVNIL
jgi:hypothetical protein